MSAGKHYVYLCGGINGLTDTECNDWRTYVKEKLPRTLEVVDPMRRDYRGRESEPGVAIAIVDGDIADIEALRGVGFVLANCARPSWGTAMEIFFAHERGVPVISVVPEGAVSPWLEVHTQVYRSLDEAIERIKGLAEGAFR